MNLWVRSQDKINYLYQEEITKHSKDIIDLIEVGDYVNRMLVMSNDYNFDKPIKIFSYLRFGKEDIKSILTHEQFEDNVYTIEKERCNCEIIYKTK